MAYLWQLWPGRGWPSTPEEERALLGGWRDAAGGDSGQVRRDALIVILGGLRCGSDERTLRRMAPTLTPADLAASYQHLDQLRAQAADHFHRMCVADSEAAMRVHARGAAVLCPAPAVLLRRALETSGFAGAKVAAARVWSRSQQVRHEADEIVAQLESTSDPVEAGRLLFDPYTPGLWGDPYFVAGRVGELTPVRVRTLLGEETDSDLIFTDVHDIARRPGGPAGSGDPAGPDTGP
jgi:hypothetical protein